MNITEKTPASITVRIDGMTWEQVRDMIEDRYGALMWSDNGIAYPAGHISISMTFAERASDVARRAVGKPAHEPSPAAQRDALSQTTSDVLAEVERATRKFPTWPTDPLHALAVLAEEFGELTKDMLQLTYEPHKTCKDNVRAEAIQTAAMSLRLLMSLDRYEYRPGVQHSQNEGGAA